MQWDDEIDRSVRAAQSFGERMAERAAMRRQDALDLDMAHSAAQEVHEARQRTRARRSALRAARVARDHGEALWLNSWADQHRALARQEGFRTGFRTGFGAGWAAGCEASDQRHRDEG